jgi:NhaP-type Na+/H+ or K+/H+ antiporter
MESSDHLLSVVTMVFVLGVGANWLAWRFGLPSILLLLLAGFLAGPVTGFILPDEQFGPLLLPIVSLSVGVILFEGGLTLDIRDLRGAWRSLIGLLTVGVATTWILSALLAKFLLGLPVTVALLLGAILSVTGPTVIGPLLRHIRPSGDVGSVAKWEGIVVDPIGATLAVLTFEATNAIEHASFGSATSHALESLGLTVLVGVSVGMTYAGGLVVLLRRFWLPDHLQSPVALMLVVSAFATANRCYGESGLLAVTVMGMTLANQRWVSIRSISEFKENLTVLLVAALFILLSARVKPENLLALGWRGVAFVAALIFVVRPVAVWLSTIGSGLSLRSRCFLSWFAPRGIVVAAVSSVFALRLDAYGDVLISAAFLTVIGTVVVYGLTAGPLARRLGLAVNNPQGLLIAGANELARAIAVALKEAGFHVVLVDTAFEQVRRARSEGLTAKYANILSERLLDVLEFSQLGRFLALTSNDEVNLLAIARFRKLWGRENVYQLSTTVSQPGHDGKALKHFSGRLLFGPDRTYESLEKAIEEGAIVKVTGLTKEFGIDEFHQHYSGQAWPLFLIEDERLHIWTADITVSPRPGHAVVSLVPGSFTKTVPQPAAT